MYSYVCCIYFVLRETERERKSMFWLLNKLHANWTIGARCKHDAGWFDCPSTQEDLNHRWSSHLNGEELPPFSSAAAGHTLTNSACVCVHKNPRCQWGLEDARAPCWGATSPSYLKALLTNWTPPGCSFRSIATQSGCATEGQSHVINMCHRQTYGQCELARSLIKDTPGMSSDSLPVKLDVLWEIFGMPKCSMINPAGEGQPLSSCLCDACELRAPFIHTDKREHARGANYTRGKWGKEKGSGKGCLIISKAVLLPFNPEGLKGLAEYKRRLEADFRIWCPE